MSNGTPVGQFMRSGSQLVKVRSLGQALKIVRTGDHAHPHGWTYHDVATIVGASKADVKAWEKDECLPPATQMKKLFAYWPKLKHFVDAFELKRQAHEARRTDEDPEVVGVEEEVQSPPPPKTFGEALRRERVNLGMDENDFAELTEWNYEEIRDIEENREGCVIFDSTYVSLKKDFPALAHAPAPRTIKDPLPREPLPKVKEESSSLSDTDKAGIEYARANVEYRKGCVRLLEVQEMLFKAVTEIFDEFKKATRASVDAEVRLNDAEIKIRRIGGEKCDLDEDQKKLKKSAQAMVFKIPSCLSSSRALMDHLFTGKT